MRAQTVEAIDDAEHRALVAPERATKAKYDGVALLDPDLLVVPVSHSGQRRHRLALRAGRDQQHLLGRQVLDLLEVRDQPGWDLEVTEIARAIPMLRTIERPMKATRRWCFWQRKSSTC